jgi:hypothetical protein
MEAADQIGGATGIGAETKSSRRRRSIAARFLRVADMTMASGKGAADGTL